MKLVVIFANTYWPMHLLHGTGEVVTSRKRKVEIELTAEQAKALKPEEVGHTGENVITEDILTMFFEEME